MDEFFPRIRSCIQCGTMIEGPTTQEDRWCYEYWCTNCEVMNRQLPPPYSVAVCYNNTNSYLIITNV